MTTFGCKKDGPQYTLCETGENLWAEYLQSGDEAIKAVYYSHTTACDKCFSELKKALERHKQDYPERYAVGGR